jgi:CRP-like cAMP-binding protein
MGGQMSNGGIEKGLKASALFRDFSDTGIKIFAAMAHEKAIPAGSPLFVEAMVGESMFIVKAGQVRITQKGPSGDRELALLGAGEHLGELALLAPGVRLVSAVAAAPCEVIEIAHRDFLKLQPQKPQACLKLAMAITADLSRRMADARDLLRDALTKSSPS